MKRITLFAGHYGSGKTCIAVSYAKYIKSLGFTTAIVDLDIVNPYFRTKDSESELKGLGIELISSEYANTNLDAPALPKEIYPAVCSDKHLVIDVGGDDRGAVALGRFAPDILATADYDMLFVANFSRPLTKTAEEALSVMREIEAASHMAFTGIVNNTNIGDETTPADIENSVKKAEELSNLSGLPIVFTTATKKNFDELSKKYTDMFKIELQNKYYAINKGEM